jgi:YD repeat-containing protein
LSNKVKFQFELRVFLFFRNSKMISRFWFILPIILIAELLAISCVNAPNKALTQTNEPDPTKIETGNPRSLIVKNKVKSSTETLCFINSEGSCSAYYEEYDKRGNVTLCHLSRMGTVYKYVFNENDNCIMEIWDSGPEERDIISRFYNSNNQLIKEIYPSSSPTIYQYDYNADGYLTTVISETENSDGNTVVEKVDNILNSLGKPTRQITTTEILGDEGQDRFKKHYMELEEYGYDKNGNLISIIYYAADTIAKKVQYKYDELDRLVEKIEVDPQRSQYSNPLRGKDTARTGYFKTTIKYAADGRIDEFYSYFSDPCMGLENHFLYKYNYLPNGLIDHLDVYEEGVLAFTEKYEYTFYE